MATLQEIAALQARYGHNTASSMARASSNAGPIISGVPPWEQMPDGGFPFSIAGTINTPAMGAGFTDIVGQNTVPSFIVPNGYDGVIRKLNNSYNGGGFVSGSGQLVYRILRNGQAIRGYDSILVQLGDVSATGDTIIRIGGGDVIQGQVSNVGVAGAGTQVFFFFGGWFYPKKATR